MAKVNLEKLQRSYEGRDFIRRWNFNLLLADVIDSNLIRMRNLMGELGVYLQEPKRDMNKLRKLSQGMVTESDKVLKEMAESFGETAEYLYEVMDIAESVPKEYRDKVIKTLKDYTTYENSN